MQRKSCKQSKTKGNAKDEHNISVRHSLLPNLRTEQCGHKSKTAIFAVPTLSGELLYIAYSRLNTRIFDVDEYTNLPQIDNFAQR